MHKKTIGNIEFTTTQIGALRQMRLMPFVLRVVAGPGGIIVEQLLKNKDALKAAFAGMLEKRRAGGTGKPLEVDVEDLKGLQFDINPDSVTKALEGFAEHLEGNEDKIFDLLADTFAKHDGQLVCLGNEANFDVVFNGKMHILIQVLFWVGQVNFADFLNSGAREVKSAIPQQAKKPLRSTRNG